MAIPNPRVGQAIDALGLLQVMRGMSIRRYTSAVQLSKDYSTANSIVDDGTASGVAPVSPKIFMGAGVILAGINEIAEISEHFAVDPYVSAYEPKIKRDAYLGLPIYASGLFVKEPSTALAAGCYIGLSIGATAGSGLPGSSLGAQVSFHIRYDVFTDHWFVVVANKWAAVGHKVFSFDLGTSPQVGIPTPSTAEGLHMEILYMPNEYVKFYLDGILLLTFTDAVYGTMLGGNDTPLADIYRQRAAVGSTIKGLSAYCCTGPVGGTQVHKASVLDLTTIVLNIA